MSTENIKDFYNFTFENESVKEKLIAANDLDDFIRLAVTIGEEYGFSFTMDEMISTMDGMVSGGTFEDIDDEWIRKIMKIGWVPLGYTRN